MKSNLKNKKTKISERTKIESKGTIIELVHDLEFTNTKLLRVPALHRCKYWSPRGR